jgi:hypothetical protein
MNIGNQVTTSGMGRTSRWKFQLGTITRISGKMICVQWEESMVEDEMKSYEIQLFNPNLLLEFSDGVKIYTGGIYRIIEENDGEYVIGCGKCVPIGSRKEGIQIISDFKKKERLEKKKVLYLFNKKYEVSLTELVLLNLVSLDNDYNRNLVDDFHIHFTSSSRFELTPLMLHEHRNGHRCEPHIRYIIRSTDEISPVLLGLLDLPLSNVSDLLG